MHSLRPNRYSLTPLIATLVAAWLTTAVGQGQLLVNGPTRLELTDPQLDVVRGTTQARLEQVRRLMEDRQFDAAIDLLLDLGADDGDRLVPTGDGGFVTLQTYCQMQLAQLPADALAKYRRREDATAAEWYREGVARRDEQQLRRVVEQSFCTSWGDDALMALGELALERGNYVGARQAWQAISQQLRDSNGRTAWHALYDVDVRRQWSKIESRWNERTAPPGWLAYPDTNLDLAAIRARLVLASIREGDLERAALELEVFRQLHQDASGRFAGQDGPLLPVLEQLLASAADWPTAAAEADWTTFARSPTRNGIAATLGRSDASSWSQPVALSPAEKLARATGLVILGNGFARPENKAPTPSQSDVLGYHPLAVDGNVYYCSEREIHAVDLATGGPALTDNGVVYQLDSTTSARRRELVDGFVAAGEPCYTMTVAGGVLYARLGEPSTARSNPSRDRRDERLVGIDLAREGLLAFQVRPDDGTWSFEGAPVVSGQDVFVAMRESDVMPRLYVACFDAATGRRQWRTSIAAADTPAAGRGGEITHTLLTLVGESIIVNSNLGVIAALDAAEGQVRWLRRYDRTSRTLSAQLPTHFQRDPSPCVYDRGALYVAPADTAAVFALDAETGAVIWSVHSLADMTTLLGIVDGVLITGGHRLGGVDARSGHVRYIWPESQHAGVRGFGRGVVAGSEVFWPTRDRIYVCDATTGRQSRQPIDVTPYSECGANLIAAGGRLIIAGTKQLVALGPQKASPQQSPAENQSDTVAERDGDTALPTSGDT